MLDFEIWRCKLADGSLVIPKETIGDTSGLRIRTISGGSFDVKPSKSEKHSQATSGPRENALRGNLQRGKFHSRPAAIRFHLLIDA
jgi:hypothetical protein